MVNCRRVLELEEVSAFGETGLSLNDSIMVTFNVDEAGAAKLAADPEIRAAHSAGRTKGVAAVMQGLSEAAKAGSASAAATLLKAGAIAIEKESHVTYEIEVRQRKLDKMFEDVYLSVAAGFEEQKRIAMERMPHLFRSKENG